METGRLRKQHARACSLVFILCLFSAGSLYAGGATQLAKARLSYEKKQTAIEKKFQEDRAASVGKQFIQLLSEAVDTYRAEGKLEEFLTAKEERERFKTAGTVDETDVVESPEFVRHAQQQFIRIMQVNHQKMLKQQAKLAKTYIRYLEGLQKKLMQKYLTDQARLVQAEVEAVQASVDFSVLASSKKPQQAETGGLTNNTPQLQLATNWDMRFERDDIAARDTASILSKCGTPQIDLTAKDIRIWGDSTYLMPLKKAKEVLGLTQSNMKKPVECAVFPPRSFFSYAFKGSFESGFDQLFLITDFKDQVVGVQLQSNDSRIKEKWLLYGSNYSRDRSLFNFVHDLKKSNPNWEVGIHVSKNGQDVIGYAPRNSAGNVNRDVIRVDSDLYSRSRQQSNKSRTRASLLLPQPIVDLMLYVVQNSR